MQQWPGAVLFDFDGVIVNSEPLHFFAFKEVLAHEHIELSQEEYYRQLIGFDDLGAFKHIFQGRGLPLDPPAMLRLMTRKSEVVMEMIQRRQYTALPGVEGFVRGLWRRYPLGICSGALREEIEAMLEGVSLRDCFGVIVAAEDVTVGKPDPSGYLKAMHLLAQRSGTTLKPADCLVIEDAPSVCRSVRKAGFPVLAVATSYPIEQLTDADWAVGTLDTAEVHAKIPQLKFMV
jgi:beta-phosphoglucomutase